MTLVLLLWYGIHKCLSDPELQLETMQRIQSGLTNTLHTAQELREDC